MWPFLNHDSSCGCVECTPSTSVCYVGANLPNTGIQNNDTISVAVQKLDAAITAIPEANQFIKSNEPLSLAQRNGDVLYGILDQYTGEEMTLSKVTGTPVVDGVMYFQLINNYNVTEYFRRNIVKINPYIFGAKGDGINNDTSAIQSAINFCQTSGDILELEGNFLSDTITISQSIKLETVCTLQTINNVDALVIQGGGYGQSVFIKHTGSLTIRGIQRNGFARGIVLKNGVLNSTFDKVYISNVGLGVDYEASGNNNIVAWNLLDIRSTSGSALTTFTKGEFVSNTTLYNIGEITTPIPILTNMGTIIVMENETNGNVFPIVAKPGTTNTYYVGNFYNLPDGGNLYYYTGGGVLHRKHPDNGAIEYKTLRLWSIAGSSITIQSFYGVTVNGGEIEGCGTNVVVGGIYMNGANPETIYSIRSLFEGLHTEGNTANKPFVYSLKNSMITFNGCLMGDGIQVAAPQTGVKFQSGYGTDRTSNYYYGRPGQDFPTIEPNDPSFKIYKDLTTGSMVILSLNSLIPMMSYMGDLRVNYVCTGEYHLLNIPVGQTRTLRVIPSGGNTLNGGIVSEDIVITGIANKTDYTVTFLLVDKNFTYTVDYGIASAVPNLLTVGTIPKAISNKTIGDGILFDNGTNILLQTANTPFFQIFDGTGYLNVGVDTAVGNSAFYNTNTFHRFFINSVGEVMRINSSGNIGINTLVDNGVDKLQINGSAVTTQYKLSALNIAPASATSTGTLGEIRVTSGFIYVCVATDTWVRSALTTWT